MAGNKPHGRESGDKMPRKCGVKRKLDFNDALRQDAPKTLKSAVATGAQVMTQVGNAPAAPGGDVDKEKYLDKRARNNVAVRRCRARQKQLQKQRIQQINELEFANHTLAEKIEKVEQEFDSMKKILDVVNAVARGAMTITPQMAAEHQQFLSSLKEEDFVSCVEAHKHNDHDDDDDDE